MARATVVSDTHLSARVPETLDAWRAVHDHVARTRPDLVVHLGDLSLDGATGDDDLVLSRRLLDELPVPWVALAGNHDIGDNPPADGAVEGEISAVSRQRWLDLVGPDRWAVELGGWRLVGVDAQLFGSDLPAAAEQWDWLDGLLADPAAPPTALLCHKPVAAPPGEGTEGPGVRYLPPAERARVAAVLDAGAVPLVLNGHVHQGRTLELGGRHHVWVATAWAVLPDAVQAPVGDKRCAVVDLDLHPDGRWSANEVVPPGLAQLTVSVDLPNPYA